MRFNLKRPKVVVCGILCVAVSVLIANSMIRSNPRERALRLYQAAVPDTDDDTSDLLRFRDFVRGKYKYEIEPIGDHSWFVCRIRLNMAPEYVQDRGLVVHDKVTSLTAEALLEAFRTDGPAVQTDSGQLGIAKKYLCILEWHPACLKVIGGTGDIPNYAKAPLKPELAASIQPPLVQTLPDGAKMHVFYTHHELSGSVRRHEFTFDRSGQLIDVRYSELGTGIGGTIFIL
ncbi:MAG: hypothetical protein ABFD69_01945 [Candidatus Sumerlaeia bacterium]